MEPSAELTGKRVSLHEAEITVLRARIANLEADLSAWKQVGTEHFGPEGVDQLVVDKGIQDMGAELPHVDSRLGGGAGSVQGSHQALLSDVCCCERCAWDRSCDSAVRQRGRPRSTARPSGAEGGLAWNAIGPAQRGGCLQH